MREKILTEIRARGSVFLGGPMTATVFSLPQRFQLVHGLSSVDAGLRLAPFGVSVPVGSIIGTNVSGKLKVAPIFVALGGSLCQVAGFALLGTLPSSTQFPAGAYGYEVLAGIGCGATYQCLYLLIPFVTSTRDRGKLTPSSTVYNRVITNIFKPYWSCWNGSSNASKILRCRIRGSPYDLRS